MRTRRRTALAAVASLLLAAPAAAQIPGLDRARDVLGRVPSLSSFLEGDPPITTSLSDALAEVPYLDGWAPADPAPLGIVPRRDDGSFALYPGAYHAEVQSYCMHAGTHGPGSGDGYLYAPLAGSKATIVESILRNSAAHPEIPQGNIQRLIWGIIARTDYEDMPSEMQGTARALLTRDQIRDLSKGALGLVPESVMRQAMSQLPPGAREVFQAEARLRSMISSGTSSYEELERVAVLAGAPDPSPDDRPVPGGRWSYHPAGYFVRFEPHGYRHTTVDLSVPGPVVIERDGSGRIATVEDWRGRRVEVPAGGAAAGAQVLDELAQARRALAADPAADAVLVLAWQWEYCRSQGGCSGAVVPAAPGGAALAAGEGPTVYDPAGDVAVPGQTGRQRLAQSPRCQKDQEALCAAVQQALALVAAEISSTQASQARYDAFKSELGRLNEQIAKAACENLAVLLEIQNEAAGLSYDPAGPSLPNNLRLVRIENHLKELAARECGGPTPDRPCGQGSKPKSPEDDAALDQFIGGIEDALKQAKAAAEQIEGQGGDRTQQYLTARAAAQGKIDLINRWLGYWKKFKTASCIPVGIIPLLQQILSTPAPHESPCLMLCNLTREWYKSLISPPMPPPQAEAAGREFMFFCDGNCQ